MLYICFLSASANKENIHTASHFNPKTFLTPTSTCVGMSCNILTPNITPSFSDSANKENIHTPSQLNPNTLLTPTSTCVGMSSNITQSTVSPVQTKRGRGRPRKHGMKLLINHLLFVSLFAN